MIANGSGRRALMLAAGLVVCFAGPSLTTAAAVEANGASRPENAPSTPVALHKYVRHSAHLRRAAHVRSHKLAEKPAEEKQPPAAEIAADNSAALPSAAPSDLSPSIANAYAQLPFLNMPPLAPSAMQARANQLLQAAPDNSPDAKAGNLMADTTKADTTKGDTAKSDNGTIVVAADELNDVDRTLHQPNAPAPTAVAAPAPAAAPANPPAPPAVAASQESSTWDQTSLIGKIFIGFGALLTMASAARMFMA